MSRIYQLPPRPPRPPAPVGLADKAVSDLRFIRDAMERSGRFTAVPGRESMAMGFVALVTAWVAAFQPAGSAWVMTWIVGAAVAATLGTLGICRKARELGTPVLAAPGRKFFLGLGPPLVAGGVLTAVLFQAGLVEALPGTWLLVYGAAVMSGGAYSVRVVPLTGLSFLTLGALAFLAPESWGNGFMALGFGGFHLAFGAIVERRHGG